MTIGALAVGRTRLAGVAAFIEFSMKVHRSYRPFTVISRRGDRARTSALSWMRTPCARAHSCLRRAQHDCAADHERALREEQQPERFAPAVGIAGDARDCVEDADDPRRARTAGRAGFES